jgi:phosphoglycolate phosphatase
MHDFNSPFPKNGRKPAALTGPGRLPMTPIRLIALDLDGTLINSAPDLSDAVNKMLAELGLRQHPQAAVEQWVGNGVVMLIKRALTGQMAPAADPENLAEALALFGDFYEAHVYERSVIYPGVMEGLQQLKEKGFKLACITNKIERFTQPLLVETGMAGYFDFIACGDSYARMKPDPLPLLKAAEHFAIEPAKALMVGDSINDMRAARSAGFRTAAVSYGYAGKYSVEDLNADYQIRTLVELVDLFYSECAGRS